MFSELYIDYLNNQCDSVWQKLSFLDYDSLDITQQEIVVEIIKETLRRIEVNAKMVLRVLEDSGWKFENFANINSTGIPLMLRSENNNGKRFEVFYNKEQSGVKAPILFAAFCSHFKVIDFRGDFDFESSFMLDSLFIESYDNFTQLQDGVIEVRFDDQFPLACLFSPDQYLKENVSGGGGYSILLSEQRLVDNYVTGFAGEFNFTFIEYLRFCFEWACHPNLFWATKEEREPFLPVLDAVDKQLVAF